MTWVYVAIWFILLLYTVMKFGSWLQRTVNKVVESFFEPHLTREQRIQKLQTENDQLSEVINGEDYFFSRERLKYGNN